MTEHQPRPHPLQAGVLGHLEFNLAEHRPPPPAKPNRAQRRAIRKDARRQARKDFKASQQQ